MPRKIPYPIYKILKIEHGDNAPNELLISTLREDGQRIILRVTDFERYSFVHEEFYTTTLQGYLRDEINVNQPLWKQVRAVKEGYKFLFDNKPVITLKTKAPKILSKLKEKFGAERIHQADVQFPVAFMVAVGLKRYFYIDKGELLALSGEDHYRELSYREIIPIDDSDIPEERIKVFRHKLVFMDIEVVPDKGSEMSALSKDARIPIYSISVAFRNPDTLEIDKTVFLSYDKNLFKNGSRFNHKVYGINTDLVMVANEKELLLHLDKILQDVTVVTFWNASFDFEYLTRRSKVLKIKPAFLKECIIFDQMVSFSKYQSVDSFQKLKNSFDFIDKFRNDEKFKLPKCLNTEIGQKYKETRKKETGLGAINLVHERKFSHYIFYAVSDVLDMWALQHVSGIDSYLGLADATGQADPSAVFVHTLTLEPIHLAFAMKHKIASPSRIERTEETIKGARVFEPVIGLHENMLVIDLSHFYPSIILAKRISPENDPKAEIPLEPQFDGKYFLEALMERTLELRFFYERKRDEAIDPIMKDHYAKQARDVKFITSGEWGYISTAHKGRYYAYHVKRQILEESRRVITLIAEKAKELGVKQLGGDTDSVFEQVPEPSIELFFELERKINEFLADFCEKEGYTRKFSIKAEKFGSRVLIAKKKKYAMLITWKRGEDKIRDLKDGNLAIKGLDLIRVDSPILAKEVQMQLLLDLLHRNEKVAFENLRKKYEDTKNAFLLACSRNFSDPGDKELLELLAKPINFKEDPESYTSATYKKYYEIVKIWNERYPDEAITARTRTFLVFINSSTDFAFLGKKYVIFTNSERIDWSKFNVNTEKHLEINFIDKSYTILEALGYTKKKIHEKLTVSKDQTIAMWF